MDRHTDWVKAKQDLSEASKRYTTWLAMPDNMRSVMSVAEYRRRRSQARQALRRADDQCRCAGMAARRATRAESRTSRL